MRLEMRWEKPVLGVVVSIVGFPTITVGVPYNAESSLSQSGPGFAVSVLVRA